MRCYFVFIYSLLGYSGFAQCNLQNEVCNLRYNEVSFLTTHNAFNADAEGFSLPNQNYGVAQQLQDGVRAFMLDVYSFWGSIVEYHGSFALGYQPLQTDLQAIKTFLDSHPNEVVTIILECNVSANDIASEMSTAGLNNYLFFKQSGQPWPLIQDMINDNKRLVVFSDVDDASTSQGWYHYMWDYMVETHYSVNDPQDFTEDYNRGDSLNDLFIFNHFVTDATIGVGSEGDAQIVNDYTFLMNRIVTHYEHHGKFANFVTLDFYDQGAGWSVVQDLNAGALKVMSSQSNIQVYPNPVKDWMYLNGINSTTDLSVEIFDGRGSLLYQGQEAVINFSGWSPGIYLVKIKNGNDTWMERIVHP